MTTSSQPRTVGLLHPGEMGAAVGRVLVDTGHEVLWCSPGRSAATAERATAAGLTDAGSLAELLDRSDVVLSVCPPHAAHHVAGAVAEAAYDGLYVDANAVAPDTARRVARTVEPEAAYVDGGIVGPPPAKAGSTRLYLSGDRAVEVRGLFDETVLDARVVPGGTGAASALKMAYAAWTKGSQALLLDVAELAATEGVAAALATEWELSLPDLADRLERSRAAARRKGWRWVGEMDEIAATMRAAGLPDGFHVAAAEVFRAYERPAG